MTITQPFDIHRALSSFNLALRAQNKSPGTVGLYSLAVRQLIVFPEREEHSCQIMEITRWISTVSCQDYTKFTIRAPWTPGTAASRPSSNFPKAMQQRVGHRMLDRLIQICPKSSLR